MDTGNPVHYSDNNQRHKGNHSVRCPDCRSTPSFPYNGRRETGNRGRDAPYPNDGGPTIRTHLYERTTRIPMVYTAPSLQPLSRTSGARQRLKGDPDRSYSVRPAPDEAYDLSTAAHREITEDPTISERLGAPETISLANGQILSNQHDEIILHRPATTTPTIYQHKDFSTLKVNSGNQLSAKENPETPLRNDTKHGSHIPQNQRLLYNELRQDGNASVEPTISRLQRNQRQQAFNCEPYLSKADPIVIHAISQAHRMGKRAANVQKLTPTAKVGPTKGRYHNRRPRPTLQREPKQRNRHHRRPTSHCHSGHRRDYQIHRCSRGALDQKNLQKRLVNPPSPPFESGQPVHRKAGTSNPRAPYRGAIRVRKHHPGLGHHYTDKLKRVHLQDAKPVIEPGATRPQRRGSLSLP
uniref:Uncharacterized protein n=1 Tax=Glossina austeni TaxID=7395 RepID=A0A1A9VHW8_GLOAU